MSDQNGRAVRRKRSSRPYRDSVVLYAVLAAVVVVVSLATGGGLARSLIVGAAAFVLATGWSWWRLRARTGEHR